MRIALLGASSQIARDFANLNAKSKDLDLVGFVRPTALSIARETLKDSLQLLPYKEALTSGPYDAIINFVGVGDPSKAAAMKNTITGITQQYDDLSLEMLETSAGSQYIFISSGVAYGTKFDVPIEAGTEPTNSFDPTDVNQSYGLAKFTAESRHRSLAHKSIIDLRVFGYFNHTISTKGSFLLASLARAIAKGETFETSPYDLWRDYINATDFDRLVKSMLGKSGENRAVDAYTLGPVSKFELLDSLKENFGLSFKVVPDLNFSNPTGLKQNYFSKDRSAAEFGYLPTCTSLENIVAEMRTLLASN